MKAKHTQGDWAFDDNEIYSESTDHGAAICTMNKTSAHFSEEEHVANARLIANAPELLQALIDAQHLFNEMVKLLPESAKHCDKLNFNKRFCFTILLPIANATQP